MNAGTVTFTTGQPVRWPPAYMRTAQVDELRRTCVRLVYVTRRGRLCFTVGNAARLAAVQEPALGEEAPLIQLTHNPLGRGARPRSKTFAIPSLGCANMMARST